MAGRSCLRRGLALLLLCGGILAAQPLAADTVTRHGLSTFGALKYGPDFAHFDYANPDAPKGGEMRTWALQSYDNLNPLILKGNLAELTPLHFDSLMARAEDEPDAMYGLIAETVEMPQDRAWAAFNLNPAARWHDGTPVTSEDVVFTFDAIRDKGHPSLQLLFADLDRVEAEGPHRVVFHFKPAESRRDLPLAVAAQPIMSKAWFAGRDFAATTMDPPLGSGPYRIVEADQGRSITYQRVPDYWAKDLPANVGRHNFDRVRVEYFRDRDIAQEALFAGAFDWRVVNVARDWASGFDGRPPVADGRIKRMELPDDSPSGVQALFLNTRRPQLADRRVRAALNLAFDFQWMNETLFYGIYTRMGSMFENSDMRHEGAPSEAELALLEPWRAEVAAEVFEKPFENPVHGDSRATRANLREAGRLLQDAGWVIRDGKLVNGETGAPFTLEFLLYEGLYARVLNPYIQNLQRLGIDAKIRVVDVASYENRVRQFDYDVIVRRFAQPLTPGVEQRNIWSARSSDMVGSFNFSGIDNPAVDALVEQIVQAKDRESLRTAVSALDRVLMWGQYAVPQFYSGKFRLAYWDRFGRPAVQPAYALGLVDTWWIDPEKDAKLNLNR